MTNYQTNREIAQKHHSNKIAEKGLPTRLVYNTISDQLILDGNAKQNLATFVTTYMEPEVSKLMGEVANSMIFEYIEDFYNS